MTAEIGDTRALGIVEHTGRVRNAVPITMKPSVKEHFTIDLLTVDLKNKYAPRDYWLYLHFNVDVI